ncbi:MAG: hypothetical protein AB8H79_18155 [Myxococcota bacterium]
MVPSRLILCAALSGCAGTAPITSPPISDGSFIPMVPVETITYSDLVDFGADLPDGVDQQTMGHVQLALGDDYPTIHTLLQGETWESRCLWEGDWEAREVASADESIVKAQMRSGNVELEVVGPGTTNVTIGGVFDGGCWWIEEPPGRQELLRVIEVVVAEPDGVRLASPAGCEEPLVVAGARPVPGFAVWATVDGEPFAADNAMAGRQVSVTLEMPDGMTTRLPADDQPFEELRFTSGAGLVSLSTPVGSIDGFEVVSPAQVTQMELGWGVPYGDSGYTLILEDGETYAWSEIYHVDARQVLVAAGSPFVGDRSACSIPSSDWFDVEIEPEGKEISSGGTTGVRGEWLLGRGATLENTGPIRLSASASELNDGQGIQAEIAVTFTE